MKLLPIKFRSFTVQFDKIIIFVLLYTFLLSLLPLNAKDKDGLPALYISLQKAVKQINVTSIYQCTNDLKPIVLTCRFITNDNIRLTWNYEKADTVYFLFKKTDEKIGWQLITERSGMKNNVYNGKNIPLETVKYVVVRATPELLTLITSSDIDSWRLFYAAINELVNNRRIQYASNEISINRIGTQQSPPCRPIWQDYPTAADDSGVY